MASEAEERIRMKCVAALRHSFPDARIIHELVLQQYGCRIDLAAVTPNKIIALEVKSERDVLDRLAEQNRQAKLVADAFIVCVAFPHLVKAREISGWQHTCAEDDVLDFINRRHVRMSLKTPCNAPARLSMLWADELRLLAKSGPNATRSHSILSASEYMTGNQVRRGVCAALRARSFPRADPAIPITIPEFELA
jgi:hypothetical protein